MSDEKQPIDVGEVLTGGGGGTYDGMEARVSRLEDDMKEIKGDLKALLRDVPEIKGKVSNLPTTLQLAVAVFAAAGLSRLFVH
jgi:hypothetical protein